MDKHQPCISIGLPVYNGENFLEAAINSLLNQTFTDFEIIISDNASTDRTESICREYALKDRRIRYYRNESNLGAARNYNRVFELATGTYFKWAAHDDVCEAEYLEKCLQILEIDPDIILSYPKAYVINEQGENQGIYTENLNNLAEKPHQRFYRLLETYGWYHGTQIFGLIRSDCLKKTLLIGNYAHADRVLLAELALHGKFAEVPEFLFCRRVHPQISQRANADDEKFAIWFDPKNLGKIMLPKWRRYSEFYRSIQRTRLNNSEKNLCYLVMMRRLFLSPGFLLRIKGIILELIKSVMYAMYAIFNQFYQPRKKISSKLT